MTFKRRYDDQQLIDELLRVAAVVPEGAVTQRHVAAWSEVSPHTFLRRFGGWRSALTAAGLGDRYSGRPVTAKMREQRGRDLSDGEILQELQRIARVVGRRQITREDVRDHSSVLGERVVWSRFGSWRATVVAAGLKLSPMANRWSEQDYLDNMQVLYHHYGRAPTQAEAYKPPSTISPDSYRSVYGSWNQAKRVLLDQRGPPAD